MRRKIESGTKVVGDRPLEVIYADAWGALMSARAKSIEKKPSGPGWMKYDDFAAKFGYTPESARGVIRQLAKQGLVETFSGQEISKIGNRTSVGWVRPVVQRQ